MLFDAIIVGAGIVGAACARELASNGLKVHVVEQGIVGGGATAAGMGHLAVMDDSEAQFALTSYSQHLWHELSEELPPTAEYLRCGSLWIAADGEEMEEVYRKYRYYTERGIPVEVLDGKQLAEAEPNLRPGMTGGLRMSADSVCYPPCAAQYLLTQAQKHGAQVTLGQAVNHILKDGVELRNGTHLQGETVVLATGVGAVRLLPGISVSPRKGHLLITDRYPHFLRHQLIELGYLKSAHSSTGDSVAFNAQPRVTGQVLIGSSRQYNVEDPAVERSMLQRMLLRAVEYMPGLASMSAIRTWTGFRASTPDKLPLIGRSSEFRNVFLATGHEGLGISTSLGTARLLVDELLDRTSAIPREPYSPERSLVAHA